MAAYVEMLCGLLSIKPYSGGAMTIQLNGEQRTLDERSTVGALLRSLNLHSDKVAVEVNLEILDKQDFETRGLQDGDQVEIMSFVGGGHVVVHEFVS